MQSVPFTQPSPSSPSSPPSKPSLPSEEKSRIMAKRNLLLCLDAFGTLYTPKAPIATQYSEVAKSLGLSGFSDADLTTSFRAAFKHESKINPNYGRATSLGSEKWWTSIIHGTFAPHLSEGQAMPKDLAPKLIERFNSKEGFTMYPDVLPLLRKLREDGRESSGKVVVGVITNSDDRTPDILKSLGLKVHPMRFGQTNAAVPAGLGDFDIDFTVMSYDVGHEKPDGRCFEAAEELLRMTMQGSSAPGESFDLDTWHKIYVGDEYGKDVQGALGAGWHAVLIHREAESIPKDVKWMDDVPPGSLIDVFAEVGAVGFSSLANLTEWLPLRP
nr:hypothetical protein B0A51_05759 [Rachicladosporium sp. CCFEE 5018]OQO26325.1 hypothetical protein B0A51_05176 [Rachicladosporium sp. CCFEE 5018]OQO26805.1 hypothetical protein B0A51_04388 [Rachicladosporium sp. CCFEE 5018]